MSLDRAEAQWLEEPSERMYAADPGASEQELQRLRETTWEDVEWRAYADRRTRADILFIVHGENSDDSPGAIGDAWASVMGADWDELRAIRSRLQDVTA